MRANSRLGKSRRTKDLARTYKVRTTYRGTNTRANVGETAESNRQFCASLGAEDCPYAEPDCPARPRCRRAARAQGRSAGERCAAALQEGFGGRKPAFRERESSQLTLSLLSTAPRCTVVSHAAAPAGYKVSEPMLMWEALRQATDEVCLRRALWAAASPDVPFSAGPAPAGRFSPGRGVSAGA